MTKNASESEIRQALLEVGHPEIAYTLAELGMLPEIIVKGSKVTITLALPFTGIPIQVKDYLINSLYRALAGLGAGLEVEVNPVEMTPEQRAKFLKMAQEGLTG